MAYKIQYTPQDAKRYPPVKQRNRGNYWRIWPAVLLLIAVLWLACSGVPDFLIPGDAAVTRRAASEMVSLLKDGAKVQDAVTAFCRQVFDGAQH